MDGHVGAADSAATDDAQSFPTHRVHRVDGIERPLAFVTRIHQDSFLRHQLPLASEDQHDGLLGNLIDTIIWDIGNIDPSGGRRLDVHVVIAGTVANDQLAALEAVHHFARDLRHIDDQYIRLASSRY
jgi:hypothetical protein